MASTTPIFYNTENICERKSSIICVFLHKYKGFKEASFRKVLDIIKTLLKERLKVYKTSAAKGMSSLSQVRQFFSEIYPMMVASQSGFDLRFLIAVLRPKALTRKQTQPFAEQLSDTHLTNLNDLYKAIYDDHKHGDFVYSLNKETLDVYDQFDEQICTRWSVSANENCRFRGRKRETPGPKTGCDAVCCVQLYLPTTISLLWASAPNHPQAVYAICNEIDDLLSATAQRNRQGRNNVIYFVFLPIHFHFILLSTGTRG